MTKQLEKILLGGGCFWCIESAFNRIDGVVSAVSGYAGGELENPTYQQVCQGDTNHVEVVEITFDPEIISYQQIFIIFFIMHDPTSLNRQGADVGTQYRSVIYCYNEEQLYIAKLIITMLDERNIWLDPVVTEVAMAPKFYPAEEYHQHYYDNNPQQGYCQAIISPKLKKLESLFKTQLKR